MKDVKDNNSMSESPRVINPAALLLRSAMSDFEIPLTKYAVSILGDLEQARDVVQDTFLKLYKQDPEKVRQKVKSWLFTVCRNHCYDLIKRNRRTSNLEEDEISYIASSEDNPFQVISFLEGREEIDEKIKILYSLIEELPSRQREVMRLKFQANLSYKEIAETIGISTSNVGFVMHSALKKLREDMKEKFPRKS
ncbi:MAG: sigma-70 family RNA polymerase sigma factor [Verrucomicrobiota bacterium]|nr:sigma-70 family RNA polymerase sigma factor [Verrucomicrobiota bacterium]MEE2724743.1 sigma-70 family RNA polymerase sigma factor [Verrucomicrobiota bacterium]